MATKSDKENKVTPPSSKITDKKSAAQKAAEKKAKERDGEDELFEDEDPKKKKSLTKPSSSKGKASNDEDEEEDVEELEDNWGKAEEEDNWDPDFDEFDIPKSKAKSSPSSKKGTPNKSLDEDEDFKFDDGFSEFNAFDDRFDDDEDDF